MAPSFACTRPVNPSGTDLDLTEAQVWKGLEMKARRPDLFVPAITSCEVIKDEGNKVSYRAWILRFIRCMGKYR